MAKASDLFKKLGSPLSSSPSLKPTLPIGAKSDKKHAAQGENVTQRHDHADTPASGKSAKAQGGAGAPGGRPKV